MKMLHIVNEETGCGKLEKKTSKNHDAVNKGFGLKNGCVFLKLYRFRKPSNET